MKKSSVLLIGLLIVGYLSCQNEDIKTEKEQEASVSVFIQKELKILSDILVPKNYKRDSVSQYGSWIRNLTLSKDNTVYYYNGEKKPNQSIHIAVLDFDIGKRDLQQCADACMRIRAEYLFEQKRFSEITFLLASGKWKSFTDYTQKRDYKSFRKYLTYIFSYANTKSLKQQLKKVNSLRKIEIGDVFVQSGNPYGHALTVMDVCVDTTGNKQFMLSQSYMPAQSIEILINPNSPNSSPWYSADFEGDLITPEWTFQKGDLRRF